MDPTLRLVGQFSNQSGVQRFWRFENGYEPIAVEILNSSSSPFKMYSTFHLDLPAFFETGTLEFKVARQDPETMSTQYSTGGNRRIELEQLTYHSESGIAQAEDSIEFPTLEARNVVSLDDLDLSLDDLNPLEATLLDTFSQERRSSSPGLPFLANPEEPTEEQTRSAITLCAARALEIIRNDPQLSAAWATLESDSTILDSIQHWIYPLLERLDSLSKDDPELNQMIGSISHIVHNTLGYDSKLSTAIHKFLTSPN